MIDCPDRKGLVAAIADFLYTHGANIVHADQHQDNHLGLFFMRVLVKRDGWRMISQEAGHPSDDVAPGTLNSIQKQAGLKKWSTL